MRAEGLDSTFELVEGVLIYQGPGNTEAIQVAIIEIDRVSFTGPTFSKPGTLEVKDFGGRSYSASFRGLDQTAFISLHQALQAELDRNAIAADEIVCTTGHVIPNRDIAYIIDVVTAECAFGMHIFKDIAASVRDVVGGRVQSLQNTFRDARGTSLAELRQDARRLKADAIIGLTLSYSEISVGLGGGSVVMVVATGTAVKLLPKSTPAGCN